MLKIIVCSFLTALSVLGIISAGYLLMLLFLRHGAEKRTAYFVIPLTGELNSDVRAVMYAYERINLFAENKSYKIAAVDMGKNNSGAEEIKRIFALCECVKVVKREELPLYIDGN